MKPSQVAQSLRHIASKIQQSRNPDRDLVARDLKRVLAVLHEAAIASDASYNVTWFIEGLEEADAGLVEDALVAFTNAVSQRGEVQGEEDLRVIVLYMSTSELADGLKDAIAASSQFLEPVGLSAQVEKIELTQQPS
jgi:hypothetical protein